ncbi:SPFH domain-containing protein [Paenibacillus sp. ACRRX]|uniref:SPFH domain-containing protein n=1 Tax=Paenibacillus sp. ACRRX TaxID=2918206 RepID=UPI001EF45E4B|nr:SPFH domain-containing protein [Paenibacillus sp. ACRRX]MCG7409239.1 SPFH domain-containing protein [Paenibacillus sp. ACRRX]
MAIIDVIKYDGSPEVFAWKYPNHELGTWTQLIVNEAQEAILYKGGQAHDRFTAGRHTLNTANIPILNHVVNLPFGGDSPFTAEVWYVNKLHSLNIKWGTRSPLQLQDPKYQLFVKVRSFGQFGIQIMDARKFLNKLVGTLSFFNQEMLTEYFRGVLMMNIHEHISSYLVHRKISILEINAYISDISKHIQEQVAPIFEEYGIGLLNFYVDSINTPEDDPATKRLQEALAKRAEMNIIGFTYQQERTFDTLSHAAKNEGSIQSDLMGAGIGLSMGYGVGGTIGGAMSRLSSELKVMADEKLCPKCQRKNEQDAAFCTGCGSPLVAKDGSELPDVVKCQSCDDWMPRHTKFCPNCGDPYNPCSKCGADNEPNCSHCTKCGQPMPTPCRHCGEVIAANVKFCPHCGRETALTCSQCSHDVEQGQKFCVECGHKLT